MNEAKDLLIPALGMVGTILIAICNLIWYEAKFAITRKGGTAHLFWGHSQDKPNLQQLIEAEQNPIEKKKLEAILKRMNLVPIIFSLSIALLIGLAVIIEMTD